MGGKRLLDDSDRYDAHLFVDWAAPDRPVGKEEDVDAALVGDSLDVLDHLLPRVVGHMLNSVQLRQCYGLIG